MRKQYTMTVVINYADTDKEITYNSLPWRDVEDEMELLVSRETEATSFVFTITPN